LLADGLLPAATWPSSRRSLAFCRLRLLADGLLPAVLAGPARVH